MNEAYVSENFDKLIVGFIGETLREKSLIVKTLMNCWPFIKFVKLLHFQTFALYGMQLHAYPVYICIITYICKTATYIRIYNMYDM